MSASHVPAPSWHQIGLELAAIRATARRERRRFGSISDRTATRLREAMAKADAALKIDDIAKASGAAS